MTTSFEPEDSAKGRSTDIRVDGIDCSSYSLHAGIPSRTVIEQDGELDCSKEGWLPRLEEKLGD